MVRPERYAEIFMMLIDEKNNCVIPTEIKRKIISVLEDEQRIKDEVRKEGYSLNHVLGDLG